MKAEGCKPSGDLPLVYATLVSVVVHAGGVVANDDANSVVYDESGRAQALRCCERRRTGGLAPFRFQLVVQPAHSFIQ